MLDYLPLLECLGQAQVEGLELVVDSVGRVRGLLLNDYVNALRLHTGDVAISALSTPATATPLILMSTMQYKVDPSPTIIASRIHTGRRY